MIYLIESQGWETEREILRPIIENTWKFRLGLDELVYIEKERVCHFGADSLPIGSLWFVKAWLEYFHHADIPRIEIPTVLREPEYLGRDYRIVKGTEVPKEGNYWIKDLEDIKSWVYWGNIDRIQSKIKAENFYAMSNIIDIRSEWRVYVCRGKIINITCYDGSASLFPDISVIYEMIFRCRAYTNLKSYTLDVGVTGMCTTVIIEVHPFVSVGLYSTLWDDNLLTAYKDGIAYCIENKDIEEGI